MHSSLEHVDACLPITALKALVLKDTKLIIQGQGPYSRLIDEESGKLLAELKIFKRNNIHGFITLNQKQQDEGKDYTRLIVWGGTSLRVVDLFFSSNSPTGESEASFLAASAEYQAPDWILAGCAPDVSNGAGTAYMVTTHNAILAANVVDGESSIYGKSIHLQLLVNGVKSILFSADTISISASHILIVAGTVFGEIIVWSCFIDENQSQNLTRRATGSIHHFFTGHEGSIFGVRISPTIPSFHGRESGRLLASCSDDRTVRIWDISDCEHASRHDPSAYSTDGFELRSTGFGAVAANDNELGSESWVAKAFGHASRIWGVYFLSTISEGQSKLNLVSRGEDATCVLWDLSWHLSPSQKTSFKLSEVSSFHYHSGKHIWSLDLCSAERETVIYTGGADGALKSFRIDVDGKGLIVLPNKDNYITTSVEPDAPEPKFEKSFKAFGFVSSDCFIATTFQGAIQLGSVGSQMSTGHHICKETLCVEEDLRSFAVIASLPQKGLALLGNAKGLIRFYNHKTQSVIKVAEVGRRPQGLFALDYDTEGKHSSQALSFITSYADLDIAELFTATMLDNAEPQVNKITLRLLQGMEVACASWIYDKQYLALGTRHGALLIYRVTEAGEALQPIICTIRLHGKEGLHQIIPFSSLFGEPGSRLEYFLTCGRDGDYCVHELDIAGKDPAHLRTIHRSSPSLPLSIEGVYIDKISGDLMLYGFRSMEFILWNETTQSEIARISCGGARRNWAFHPSDKEAGAGLLLFGHCGFRALRIQANINRTLRAGGHGREIKAMGVSHSTHGYESLFVTGAEDTTLRIFTPAYSRTDSPWGTFKCLRVLKDHTVGVQQIRWSRNGKFLFTSAGFEEFFVWKVRSIPLFGLATTLDASCPKDNTTSELRVVSFDILEVEEEQAECAFLLCLAMSNSVIKIFHYSSLVDGGRFTLLARGSYTSNCLTQASFVLNGSSVGLITASTDGHFTTWNLNPVLESFYSMESPILCLKQAIETISTTPETISCENRYRIHSNSVKSLEFARISDRISLVVAGGDDNSLSLSLLDTNFASSDASNNVYTVTIPDAHAASVTTIKIVEQHEDESEGTTHITVASSGNDHRVKLWCVEVDVKKSGLDRIKVKNLADQYSSVADISSLDVIRNESGLDSLLVCGVGMEMLSVK